MRMLWVKAGKLLPVDTGGKIRSYNILRELAANHDLTLLTYYGGKRDADYERAIAELISLYLRRDGFVVAELHREAALSAGHALEL